MNWLKDLKMTMKKQQTWFHPHERVNAWKRTKKTLNKTNEKNNNSKNSFVVTHNDVEVHIMSDEDKALDKVATGSYKYRSFENKPDAMKFTLSKKKQAAENKNVKGEKQDKKEKGKNDDRSVCKWKTLTSFSFLIMRVLNLIFLCYANWNE